VEQAIHRRLQPCSSSQKPSAFLWHSIFRCSFPPHEHHRTPHSDPTCRLGGHNARPRVFPFSTAPPDTRQSRSPEPFHRPPFGNGVLFVSRVESRSGKRNQPAPFLDRRNRSGLGLARRAPFLSRALVQVHRGRHASTLAYHAEFFGAFRASASPGPCGSAGNKQVITAFYRNQLQCATCRSR